MPYKSDSQRRWAHTDKGEKALGGPKNVHEWDEASKGKDLPEKVKKMADGGVVDVKEVSYTPPVPPGQENSTEPMGIEDKIASFIKNLYGAGPMSHDKNEAAMADAIEPENPMLHTASNTQGFAHGGMPGYDDGGVVEGNEQPQFDPKAGMPPTPPQTAFLAPNPLTASLNAQASDIDKYGPSQQVGLSNNIIQKQNSPGSLVGQGLAGLGDALVQGVGRAGNPGFLNALQNRQEKQGAQQLGVEKEAREANMQNIQEKMKLTAQDPTSPLSKAAQASYGPTLMSLGATKAQIAAMPASVIADVANKNITLKEALARIEETGAYQQGMLQNAQASRAQQEAEFETSNPVKTFIAKHFGNGGPAASQTATNAMPAIAHVTSQAEYDALPPGAHFVDSTGQRKVKGSK